MLKAFSMAKELPIPEIERPNVSPLAPERRWNEPTSLRFIVGAALGLGFVSFLATELMHYILVPDIGRHQERLLAEGLSALVVSCLTARLLQISRERHRLMMARMQVIAEMNHHIRNALSPISLSVDIADNQQLFRVISEGVERIDWALREILPRESPLPQCQGQTVTYFQRRGANSNERH